MLRADVILIMATALLYSGIFLFFVFGLVTKKEGFIRYATKAGWIGLFLNLAAVVIRWLQAGHPPVNMFELNSLGVCLAIALYLFLQWKVRELRVVGVVVFGFTAILLGWSLTLFTGVETLKPEYQSIWLVAHIFSAFTALAFYLMSFAISCLYFLNKSLGRGNYSAAAGEALMDEYNVRLVAAGFVSHALMLITGAIWAQEAWGSYWSWDPVETWTLLAWLLYGLFLHLYFSFGWRGVKLQIMTLAAFPIIVFCYWWIPHLPLSNF